MMMLPYTSHDADDLAIMLTKWMCVCVGSVRFRFRCQFSIIYFIGVNPIWMFCEWVVFVNLNLCQMFIQQWAPQMCCVCVWACSWSGVLGVVLDGVCSIRPVDDDDDGRMFCVCGVCGSAEQGVNWWNNMIVCGSWNICLAVCVCVFCGKMTLASVGDLSVVYIAHPQGKVSSVGL